MINPAGSKLSPICFVGDCPSPVARRKGFALSGPEGFTLNLLCKKAGLNLERCYRTTAARTAPPHGMVAKFFETTKKKAVAGGYEFCRGRYAHPSLVAFLDELHEELEHLGCNVVVPLGEVGFWSVTGMKSISKWRGSMLESAQVGFSRQFKIIPTYSPDELRRRWDWSYIVTQDLRRVFAEADSSEYKKPQREYTIRPSFAEVMGTLQRLVDRADGMTD